MLIVDITIYFTLNTFEQQQRGAIPQQNPAQLADTLSNLSAELANTDDEEAGEKIKSWIEQG